MVLQTVSEQAAPPPREERVRVRGLSHRVGKTDVLRDVGFEVGPGEIFGLIGPRGAGKTTALRAIATLLVPSSGRIEVAGADASLDARAVRRRIGYVGADDGVYPRLSVREHLEFHAAAHRVEDGAGAVDRALWLTDLRSLQHRRASTLSRAMQVRMHLARLSLTDPMVWLLDEPDADLDARARLELAELVANLAASGKTILFASRRLGPLADVGTCVAVLHGGRIALRGPPREVSARAEAARKRRSSDIGAARMLKLRVLGDAEAVVGLLEAQPGILSASATSKDVVMIEILGSDARIAEMVRGLVGGGISVVGLAPDRGEFDDVLLLIGPRRS
jgi:ABC-2 type transport system ATP-binding protein